MFCIFDKLYSQDKIISPREIISKAIEAMGGEKVLRELENKNNYTLKGSSYFPKGDLSGVHLFYFKKAGRIREEKSDVLEKNKIKTGPKIQIKIYNNERVLMTENGKVIDDISQIEDFKNRSKVNSKIGFFYFLYLLDHPDRPINYIGEELIGGRKCLGIEIPVISKNIKNIYFFDSETFLMTKNIRGKIRSSKKDKETITYYYDFRKVNNANFPFRNEIYNKEVKVAEFRVQSISFDEIDDGLFEIEEKK